MTNIGFVSTGLGTYWGQFALRWGYVDGAERGWKYWTTDWTGSATWDGQNTLDLDFDSLIPAFTK